MLVALHSLSTPTVWPCVQVKTLPLAIGMRFTNTCPYQADVSFTARSLPNAKTARGSRTYQRRDTTRAICRGSARVIMTTRTAARRRRRRQHADRHGTGSLRARGQVRDIHRMGSLSQHSHGCVASVTRSECVSRWTPLLSAARRAEVRVVGRLGDLRAVSSSVSSWSVSSWSQTASATGPFDVVRGFLQNESD